MLKDVSLLKASSNITQNGQFFDFSSKGTLDNKRPAVYRKVRSAVMLAIGRISTNLVNTFYFLRVEKWFENYRNRKIKS